MRLYLIRYAFEWGNGHRHGLIIPRGIYDPTSREINWDRHAWTFAEAEKIRDGLNQFHGDGSHWIVSDSEAMK